MCVFAAAAGAGLMSAGTAAGLSLATTAASTIFSFIGQGQEAKAQASAFNYQAAVDRNNAQLDQWRAEDAIKRGQEDEARHRIKVNQVKGAQRAAFADNGIDLSSDNVLDTIADTAYIGQLDALQIRDNAQREAWGYNISANNYLASAGMNETAARNTKSAGKINQFTTLLGGASTLADRYSMYRTKGAL